LSEAKSQINKVFQEEMDENKNPSSLFYENQLKFYNDSKPHRHKYKGSIPLYSLWVDKYNREHRVTYVQSRQFYCTFYERAVCNDSAFLYLKEMVNSGLNILIHDYDGYGMNQTFGKRNKQDESYGIMYDIEKDYLDPRSPYGHGKVLYAMLILTAEEYPWRKYKMFDF
jgi:hypothetical protein